MFVSWWLAWKYQDRFISDWDGYDYTSYAVRGWPSTLGLGRALFLGYNNLLWKFSHRFFNTPPEHAYLVFRYGVIALSGPATVGIYALCKELTASRLSAFLGALLVAASPFYIVYSGRTMSEIPAFFLLGWSLWWMLRSLRLGHVAGYLVAAYLVGLSANLREFAIFYFPFVMIAARIYGRGWKLGLSAIVPAIFGALAGVIFWSIFMPDIYWDEVFKWYRLSAHEREVHPVTIDNFSFLAKFAFNCSSVIAIITPFAFLWLWSRKELRGLFIFGGLGLLADAALLLNHDLAVNPRYLLTGLLGLAAVSGWCLAELIKCYRVWAVPLLAGFMVLTKSTYNNMAKDLYDQEWSALAAKSYISKIESLPWNSAFIVGSRTPLINLYYWVGARPYWKTISPGSSWPDDKLDEAVDDLFLAGRVVYVDFDPALWQPGLRAENREGAGLEMIRKEYRLEHIRDSFYRIVERNTSQVNSKE